MPNNARHGEAHDALRRAERLALGLVDTSDRERVVAAFRTIEETLARLAPQPVIRPGSWEVRPLESFDAIEETARGKVICPLCGVKVWGRDSLAHHLQSPHGTCSEPGCGKGITAAGMHAHLASRHGK
jgi:hypothetical protein